MWLTYLQLESGITLTFLMAQGIKRYITLNPMNLLYSGLFTFVFRPTVSLKMQYKETLWGRLYLSGFD
jgi:hypothetical protein